MMQYKFQKQTFLTLVLVSLLLIQLVQATFTVKQGITFKTSNNAQFSLAEDIEFYKVELDDTFLWLDKSFSSHHYTRYCIYAISPSNTQFTIDSWFNSTSSTAQLTITSPTATNIYLGFTSPNLITASVIGAVSQTWYAANKTLLFTVNTATSATFTITAGATETDTNPIIYPTELAPVFAYEMGEFIRFETSIYTQRCLLFDSSTNKNYGTFNSTDEAPTQAVGKLGYGLLFDGVNDWVNVSSSSSMQLWTLQTICVWINLNVESKTQGIIYKYGEYDLYVRSDGKVEFRVYNGETWYASTSTTTLDVDTWYFIIAELYINEINIYVDNTLENTTELIGGFTSTSNIVEIGRRDGSDYFSGIIDELQGYHRLLDDTEKVLVKLSQISLPQNYIFTKTIDYGGTYGFYDNHLERPWAEDDAYVQVDYYVMGFQTFHSVITINQSGDVDPLAFFGWSFYFYKAGEIQVVYSLYIEYINLTDKQVILTWERWLPKPNIFTTFKQKTLDLNGTGTYATAWKIAIDAGNYIEEKTFQIRIISDTQTQVVVDTLTGEYWWEYFFDLVDEDGNTVNLGHYDAFVKVQNFISSNDGIKVMISEHTHFAWVIFFLVLYIIVATASIGLATYVMMGGNLADIPLIGGALQAAADWITNLAIAIANFLRPVGEWIVGAFISTMLPIVTALMQAGQQLWNWIVQGMDYLLSFTGNTHLFTDIITFLGMLVTNIGNAFSFIGTMLTQGFTLLGVVFSNIATVLTSFVGTFINVWNYGTSILGGAYGIGLDFWAMVSPVLPSLLTLLAIGYMVWLIVLWEEKGLGAIVDHVRGLFEIASFILGTLLHIAQVFIQFINGLIEAIPF